MMSRPKGHSAVGRIKSMKNSADSIRNVFFLIYSPTTGFFLSVYTFMRTCFFRPHCPRFCLFVLPVQHTQRKNPCPRRDSNPQPQQETGRRPSSETAGPPGRNRTRDLSACSAVSSANYATPYRC